MSNTSTLTLAKSEINKLNTHYAKYRQQHVPAYVAAVFVLPACRITVYESHKVVFQGKDATQESALWGVPTKKPQIDGARRVLTSYIGCDETGVGDYFLPLVVAACYINPRIEQAIRTLNIKDSKQLNDAYIRQIAPTLRQYVPYAIYTLPNDKYNEFIVNGYNAHSIKAFVHNKAITRLIEKAGLAPNTDIVMDQFASKKNYAAYLKGITPVYIPTVFETKAENKYLGVAIASIIARASFLATKDGIDAQYGVDFPFGAGKHVDTFGVNFLTAFGMEAFKDNVKWHFANTNRIVRPNDKR
jgi:ribonuclease HIII